MYRLTCFEAQRVVSPRIGREPIVAFDIFPKSLKGREGLVFFFLQQTGGFYVWFDNLEVLILDPDAAFKAALALFHFFGGYVENIGADLVDRLSADILDVIVSE